jgi:hypothetical protein
VQALERLLHLEAHAPRVEGVVAGDLRALEVEEHGPVRPIQADGRLRHPLVGAVADAQEAALATARVEEVEVHALVEVRLARIGVHELVGGLEPERARTRIAHRIPLGWRRARG